MRGFAWACGAALASLLVFAAGAEAQHRQHGRGHHHHGFMEGADANGDGAITREEAQGSRAEAFARFDADGDGFLTEADREAHRRARMERRRERRAARMARLDTDHDGRVSRTEFLAAPSPHFDRVDANHNGVIERDEIEAAHAARRGRRRSHDEPPPAQTP